MITPEPVPCSWLPVTLIVTTLGWILAAAPVTVPSTLAVVGAPWVLVVMPAELFRSLWSTSATVPAPMPPPTIAATTAAIRTVRTGRGPRAGRCCAGGVAGGWYGPNGWVGAEGW